MHDLNPTDHSCRVRRRSSAFHAIPATEPQDSADLARELPRRNRPQEAPAERDERLSTVAALRLALSELGPEQGLARIAREALAGTGAEGSAIATTSQKAVVCCARAGDLGPPLGTPIDVRSGLSGQCLRTGEVVCCADTETDPRVEIDACRESGIRSVLAVPIRRDEQIIGVFAVFSDRLTAFGDREVRFLQSLAELASEPRQRDAPALALTPNASESESQDKGFLSKSWTPAQSRHVMRCLETIRQDPALRILGRAKAYLTIEALHDETDRSHPIAVFEELMLQRANEIGPPPGK